MRIVSGVAGGIRLHAPRGTVVRPTEDRVKESLFGALGDLSGARVLDLFAGTGALGLEALSRGAASVVFVERSRQVLPFLRDNIAAYAARLREHGRR
jgi:16S rRNA (guanine966-N2)-methyltransferase